MAYKGNMGALPIAIQGFSGADNQAQMQPGHLAYTDSFVIEGKILQKEGGATKFNAVALAAGIVSGFAWTPVGGTNYDVVFLENGSVLRDDGAGTFPTSLATGLNGVDSTQPPPVFATGGGESVGAARKLFMFSHSNQAKVVAGTGTSLANISTPPADWTGSTFPIFGVTHEGRMFAGGNANDPHRLYYSQPTNHENFTGSGSGSISVYPGEGERIVGAVSFRGALVIWKYPRGVYVLNTGAPSPNDWAIEVMSQAVGSLSQHTIVQIDNDVLYMDHAGWIHALSATRETGGIETSNISKQSDMGTFAKRAINTGLLVKAVGMWHSAKQQAWFAAPRIGALVNTIRIILDRSDPQVGNRFFLSRRDRCPAMWIRPDAQNLPSPASGDDAGFVWLMDREDRNKDGAMYESRLETAYTDLSFMAPELAGKNKTSQFLELVAELADDWNLLVEIWWDDKLTSVIQFEMGSGGVPLDTFELDTDVLSSSSIASQRRRASGSGRRLRLVVYNQGLNHDVTISGFILYFKVHEEATRAGMGNG